MAGRLTGFGRFIALAVASLIATAIFSTTASAFASDFTQTGGPTGGQVTSITAHLSNVWAVTANGRVFRSTDDGLTWAHVQTVGLPQQLWLRQIVDINGETLLMRDVVDIYRSTDSGTTWSLIDVDFTNMLMSEVVVEGATAIVHLEGAEDRLFVTHDSGETWDPILLPFPDVQDVFFKDEVLLVSPAAFGELSRSLNFGAMWTPVGSELPADLYQRFAVGQNSIVLQCVFSGQFFHSTDTGATWSPITPPFAGTSFFFPVGVADGNATMFTAFASQSELTIYRSDDDGETWQSTNAAGLPDQLVSSSTPLPLASDDPSTLLLGYGFSSLGMFRSIDGGVTWNESNDGLVATTLNAVGSVGDSLMACVPFLEINYFSPDGGDVWEHEDALADTISYEATSDSTVFAGSFTSGISRSDNAGFAWTPVNTGLPIYNSQAGAAFQPINDFALHNEFLFAATGGGNHFVGGDPHCGCTTTTSGDGVYRSSNNGASWQRVSSGLPINIFHFGDPILRPITALQSIDGALLAATPMHGVYRTTNNGNSWSGTAGAPGGTDLALFNGDVYLADGAGLLYRSTNGGASWSLLVTDLPGGFTFKRLHAHDGVMYAITGATTFGLSNGIYSTTDGSSWQSASTALADVPVSDIASHGGDLVVATVGRGAWIRPALSPADVNSDGAVDVFDLFDVLGAWGACAAPCPPTCAEDANQDCNIDIFDLVEVLSAWTD